MTVKEITDRVKAIDLAASDDEVAHIEEDKLHREVLAAIARGECEDPAACAREALKTNEIEFSRWYA